MNLKIGIVGLPNAGKSTLFNALLKKQVADVANYPFTTIEPNVGVVPVPDSRLAELAKVIEESESIKPPVVPAVVEFVDIAGLVKGASKGEGLGNKFLAHIREVHLIVNVLRYFDDPSVVHVSGDVDPKRDSDIIETELILSDLQTLAKQPEPFGFSTGKPQGRSTKKDFEKWQIILRLRDGLNAGTPARLIITDPEERAVINDLHLLSMKPVLYVMNVSEQQIAGVDSHTATMKQFDNCVMICAKTEYELAGLSENEQAIYLHELGLSMTALDRLIRQTYEMLGLISFLTCGPKEVRAWTIKHGTKALQAAGVIHTDFEKKFIKADVIQFVDFMQSGGWLKAREAGKVRSEGSQYHMRDGDVVDFKVGT